MRLSLSIDCMLLGSPVLPVIIPTNGIVVFSSLHSVDISTLAFFDEEHWILSIMYLLYMSSEIACVMASGRVVGARDDWTLECGLFHGFHEGWGG